MGLLALVGGCGGDDGGGDRDGGTDTDAGPVVRVDAGPAVDSGPVADAGPGVDTGPGVDGGPPPDCPGTCPYTCAIDCVCARDACGCDLELCASDCGGMLAAMQEEIAAAASCTEAADCTTTLSPLCADLGCHIAHDRDASLADLHALAEQYRDNACVDPMTACRCGPAGTPRCEMGRCTL